MTEGATMKSIDNMRQTEQERVCRPIGAAREQDTASDETWPQNGPEGTMESLAGLRVYVGRHARMDEMTKAALMVYAREIEREVKELTDERDLLKTQWEAGVDFDQRLESCADNREDVTLWGVDYTPLPVDADGVPIHVGDVMELDSGAVEEVESMHYYGSGGWTTTTTHNATAMPSIIRHHHAPTVEDVLLELLDALDVDVCRDPDKTIAEYAAKLRLAGEDE